jgi:hypothetical protein
MCARRCQISTVRSSWLRIMGQLPFGQILPLGMCRFRHIPKWRGHLLAYNAMRSSPHDVHHEEIDVVLRSAYPRWHSPVRRFRVKERSPDRSESASG